METGSLHKLVRRRITEEVDTARARDDRWLLVHFTRKPDRTISLGSDTVFVRFQNSREFRGPRWRTLADAREFSDVGYSWVVAGERTAFVLFRQLLAGRVPKGVVMHVDALHRWAPRCAKVTATVNSVTGFQNHAFPENRGLSAKRPGRVTRARLTAGGCHLCKSNNDLTLHHLIPREMGGATEEENLLTVCRPCHDAIHSREIDVTDLVMEVHIKRTIRLLGAISNNDANGSGADDV